MVSLKMEHIITSFILFSILVGLTVNFYGNLTDSYDLTKGAVNGTGDNVMDGLQNINALTGMDDLITGIHKVSPPTGAQQDLLGGVKLAGIGVLKLITGVITLPVEIFAIITGFYDFIPSEVFIMLGVIFTIYVGFVIVNRYAELF